MEEPRRGLPVPGGGQLVTASLLTMCLRGREDAARWSSALSTWQGHVMVLSVRNCLTCESSCGG
jgi:hypothetical protein